MVLTKTGTSGKFCGLKSLKGKVIWGRKYFLGGDTRKDTMKGIAEEERVAFFEEGYSFYIKF